MTRREKRRRDQRRYFRLRPRRVLPVYVGECPDCRQVVTDVYAHLVRSHGWELL